MERVSVKAVPRTAVGKNAVKKIRRSGLVPAILYGKARAPLPLAVGRKDLLAAIQQGGRNVLIDLRIARNGEEESDTVMIADIQRHHLRREILHVDLHHVSLTETLVVHVPVVLVGTPEGVASGGILEHHLREVVVRCLPTQIPDRLTVNVSRLRIGDSIHVRDLPVAEGVELVTPPEEVIASVVATAAEEAAAAAGEGPAEPEVVGRPAAAEGEARPEAKAGRAEPRPARTEKKE